MCGCGAIVVFFFKQKTAYEMRISDWSSDVCSSDLVAHIREPRAYLFTTARSVVLQHVRRSRIVAIEAVAEIHRLDIDHDERPPDRNAMAGQELRRIAALIAAFPAKCREASVPRYGQSLSHRDIARSMPDRAPTAHTTTTKGSATP